MAELKAEALVDGYVFFPSLIRGYFQAFYTLSRCIRFYFVHEQFAQSFAPVVGVNIKILLPDLSMIGYLFGTKAGARLYNLFHHKLMAVVLLIAGFWWHYPWLALSGVILLGHSSMDRMLGYGLKYDDGFHHTHLGKIGKKDNPGAKA